jgi:hypothetical protein
MFGAMFELGIAALVVLLAAGTIAGMVWADRRTNRQLHELERTPIRDVVGGERVRVIGMARKLADDVAAAYSGTICIACKSWVYTSGDGDSPDDIVRVVPFRVEDETGSIAVAVEHATLQLRGHSIDLDKAKVFGAGIMRREAGGTMDVWEDRLEPDTRVAVIGIVVRGDDGAYRLTGREHQPLVIANVDAAFVD